MAGKLFWYGNGIMSGAPLDGRHDRGLFAALNMYI